MQKKNYRIYGTKPDGTLSVCRARPEYRGKGTCKHGEHIELERTGAEAFVNKYNERALEEHYQKIVEENQKFAQDTKMPEGVSADRIQSHSGGRVLSREELTRGAKKVAENFKKTDWDFITEFHRKYEKVVGKNDPFTDASKNISEYLRSDDDTALKLREFLGDEVNLEELSDIIVYQVKAMTFAEKWAKGKRPSMKRVIFSTLNNDMTRTRYVNSVLFFGGRCCYCNKVLRKNPPPGHQASGEHLTPLSPEDPNAIHGGTRYGNMALACVSCNRDRKNTDLVEWIHKTRLIKRDDKPFVLGRIQAFREYALYEEYTREENDRIAEKVEELQNFVNSCRKDDGQYIDNANELINERLKVALYDLRHSGEDEDEEESSAE